MVGRRLFLLMAICVVVAGCWPGSAEPDPGASPDGGPGTGTGGEDLWSVVETISASEEATVPLPAGAMSGVVPFAILDPYGTDEPAQAQLGYWDLASGQVVFADGPLFVAEVAPATRGPRLRLFWDGGSRLGVAAPAGPPSLVETHPAFTFAVLDAPANRFGAALLLCPSGETGFLVLSRSSLELRGGTGEADELQSYALPVTGRPVDIRRSPAGVEVLVEAVVQTQETSGIVLYGLSLRNGAVSTEWVTAPLDLDEAGSGTRWARVGGRAYVAKPGGTIRYVDLATRELIPAETLNASLESVLGQIVCHQGYLTVMREGRLTQELDLDPSRQPFWWFAGSGTGP